MVKRKMRSISSVLVAVVMVLALVGSAYWLATEVSAGTLMYDGVGGTFTGSGSSQKAVFNTPETPLNGWGTIDSYVVDESVDTEELKVMPIRYQVTRIIVGPSATTKALSLTERVPNFELLQPESGQHGVLVTFTITNTGDDPVSIYNMELTVGGQYTQWFYTSGSTAYAMPGRKFTYYLYTNVSDDSEMLPQLCTMNNDGTGVNSNSYVYLDFPYEQGSTQAPETTAAGPEILAQPKNVSTTVGATAKFNVAASGVGPLSYQWQYRPNSWSIWSKSSDSGATTDTLSVVTNINHSVYEFRCIVTDANGQQVISDTATISFKPSIIEQPSDVSVEAGATAKFSVKTNMTGTVTYQWQSRKNSTASWTNSGQSGAKTATLSVNAIAGLNGWQFRCIAKDSSQNQSISDPATLTVSSLRITTQPANVSAEVGSTVRFSVGATGSGNLTYQWQSRGSSTASWANSGMSTAKTANLSVNAIAGLSGWQFRCVVKDGKGQTVVSDAATLTLDFAVTAQPQSTEVITGSTAKFSVRATGQSLTYQWQSRKNSSATWTNSGQSGAKTATLSVNAIAGLNGWQFRCIVKDGKGNKINSKAATLSVVALKFNTQPTNTSVIAGSTAKFTVAASGVGTLSYQWQSRKNSSATWTNSGQSGAKTATLSVNAIAGLNGWQFRCIVKDTKRNQKASDTVTLTVYQGAAPSITTQPANRTVKVGVSAKFTVAATGTGTLTYQWQSRKNSASAWTNSGQSGAKTATLSVNAIAGLNGWQFRCIVKDKYGRTVASEAATLKIQ